MTPEGEIEAYLVKSVKASGGRTRKIRWIGRRGAPDRLVWWPGPFMAFVEVKRPGAKPTALQSNEINKLFKDGFNVYIADSKDEVNRMITIMKTLSWGA